MESSPRTTSISHLERRIIHLSATRVRDEQTFFELESLLNECSTHLDRLISASDSSYISTLLPSLLHTIVLLSKNCSEKSDMFTDATSLSREKISTTCTLVKTLHNRIKEFIKSPKLITILVQSSEQSRFCEQLRLVSDAIVTNDVLTGLICYKLIVKLLTANDEQPNSRNENNGIIMAVCTSLLRQMSSIDIKNSRDKPDTNRESSATKMYGIYCQMLAKLIQQPGLTSQISTYTEFIRTIIQLHICLESSCQQNRFQLEFFHSTIYLQEILQEFTTHTLIHSSKLFFDEFWLELIANKNKYASLIVLLRSIEAFDVILTQHSNEIASHLIGVFVYHLFELIDQCRIQLVLPALLPVSFAKTQVEYGGLYDITYSHLIRLFNHQPVQTVISAMDKLIDLRENSSITSTSVQLACELIIQSWFLHHSSSQFQYLFGLFLAELLRLDIHSSLLHHLLTMPHIHPVKFLAYDALISSESFYRIYDFFISSISNNYPKESIINPTNLSLTFPTSIEHLYSFVRLFTSELNPQQIQHAFNTCLFSFQQFLSLPIITEMSCTHFLQTLRLLARLPTNSNEIFKSLLGQLTQIFVLLDEHHANDVRLELLRLFAVHSIALDDNDLGRLLDFMLTSPLEANSHSTSFHLVCLDVIDSLKQRPSRSTTITDLIIQLFVRYGNEHQCSTVLKIHLMQIFMGFMINSNDDSLPARVKAQCVLLRASIDEFEKSKRLTNNNDNNDRFYDEIMLNVLDTTTRSSMRKEMSNIMIGNEREVQLRFYRTIVNELELDQCLISTHNTNAMQQD